MTMKQLAERVAALEAEVTALKAKLAGPPPPASWADTYGKYADDPVAAEVARLGKEWRDEERRRELAEMDAEEAKAKKKKPRRKANAGA